MSVSAELEEFRSEACELLDVAEKSLLRLDEGGDFGDCYNAIFRSLHNLKGGSAMLELSELSHHTHELETIFTTFQNGPEIPAEYLSFFLKGIDAARLMLAGEKVAFSYVVEEKKPLITIVPEAEEPLPLSGFTIDEFIMSCREYTESISKNLLSIDSKDAPVDVYHSLYRDVHSLKGDAYLFSYQLVGDVAHAMESALEPLRNGEKVADKRLVSCLLKALDVVELVLAKENIDDEQQRLKKMVDAICHALVKSSQALAVTVKAHPAQAVVKEKENPKSADASSSSIRVSVSLLDNLMTLMGEMVLVRNQVLQYSNKTDDLEFLSMSKRLNMITSEIQEQMMKTRMQSIGNVLSKFNRVVRDLADDLGKKISVNIQGSETELDKSLLEAIKDPLTHIVRNSCDHGIESPEERIAKGKSEVGNVEIKAYHEGGQVFIEVSDDGKGLSRQSILNKALEKNLINPSLIQTLSDKEIFDLIFLPGFSTAQHITNVSGRGVGMDVVRTNIERIGGTVELWGKENTGTTIKIKIPLTLAIIPALMVKCGEDTFAIPQLKLEELVRVDLEENPHQIETLHGTSIYRLRGNILQLVDMNRLLGRGEDKHLANKKVVNIAVLNADNYLFGVIIDEVLDTADIVVKPLNRILKSLQIYSGATILGDGSVALIFDVLGITKVAQMNSEQKNKLIHKVETISEVQDFLLVGLNCSATHAISLSYVNRLEEFKRSDVEYSGNQMVIRYRKDILPLIDVNKQLGYQGECQNEILPVIVIERAGISYGLIVNKILDTLSTIESVRDPISFHQGIVGNINADRELIVVTDPFQIVDKSLGIIHGPITNQTSSQGNGRKVLLVEDTSFFRRMIKSYLEKNGYQVFIAQNGLEAIEVLNDVGQEISIIISDIEMPRMNGFEMARIIRKQPQYKKLPMIAVSSKADQNYRQEGMNAGFDMYLEKLRPEVLLAAINELDRSSRRVA